MPLRTVLLLLIASMGLIGCRLSERSASSHYKTLHDYALQAQQRGSREAAVPYGGDEEEGSNLVVRSLDDALRYEWVVGEPIDEKTIAYSSHDQEPNKPDFIYTLYRFRVEQRVGRRRSIHPEGRFEKEALATMPVSDGEVLVAKSGGNIVIDHVLLKKHGSVCFNELMPRRYLLGLKMSSSGRVGWLEMGCQSIFLVDGDRLSPRQAVAGAVTEGICTQHGNSLSAFLTAVTQHQQP